MRIYSRIIGVQNCTWSVKTPKTGSFLLQDEEYQLREEKLGPAIILNNVHATRVGSHVDVAALEKTYAAVGFDVMTYKDFDAMVSE